MVDHALVIAPALSWPDPSAARGTPAHVSLHPRPCGLAIEDRKAREFRMHAAACLPPRGAGSAGAPQRSRSWFGRWADRIGAACRVFRGGPAWIRVPVRVYNAAGTTAAEQRRALDEASGILRGAGVAVVWRLCGRGTRRGDVVDPGCSLPPPDGELILRIGLAPSGVERDVMGYSYVPGVVATVLADRVREAAVRTGTREDRLLGGAAAHEIGHLLLGGAHAHAGLMRSVWSDEELRRASAPLFALSSQEARQIAERLSPPQAAPQTARTRVAADLPVLR